MRPRRPYGFVGLLIPLGLECARVFGVHPLGDLRKSGILAQIRRQRARRERKTSWSGRELQHLSTELCHLRLGRLAAICAIFIRIGVGVDIKKILLIGRDEPTPLDLLLPQTFLILNP
jgi:hypothetical protein